MATIQTRLEMTENISAKINSIVNSTGMAVSGFQDIQNAGDINVGAFEAMQRELAGTVISQNELNAALNSMDISSANAAYNQLNATVNATERGIRDNVSGQQRFNDELQRGASSANGLKGAIAAMVGGFTVQAGVKWVQQSLDMTNQQINAEQQLANVLANQGATEADFLALKRQAAAVQDKSMYGSTLMTGVAAELATYISDADALKHMMGTVANYAAGMSGGAELSYSQMVDYATQLGKALDGTYDGLRKKGFELTEAQKAIIDNGTDMERALVIDAVINQSWAGLAEQMAQTPQGMQTSMANAFNDIRANIGAQLMPMILLMFTTIQGYLPQIQEMLYGFVPIIQNIIQTMGTVIDAAFAVYQFFVDNWSWIEPVLWGIIAAFVAWKVITLIQTIAQWALNAALLANPITWIVLAIAAIIVAIVAWANSVGGFRVLWMIVVNAILTAWDWIKIGFFTGVYWVIDLWDKMKLGMMAAGVGIANFMGDMKANVLMILQNMVNGAIDIINGFIGILNKIPGMNIGLVEQVTFGTQAKLQAEAEKQAREDDLAAYRSDIEAGIAERANKLDAMKDDARVATLERLSEIDDAREAATQKSNDEELTTPSDFVFTNFDGIGRIADDTANIAGNTQAMKNTGEENLRYLRDIAERESINRFTTAEVHVDFGGITNHVSSDMDLNGIVEYINDGVREALEITAEGVYA